MADEARGVTVRDVRADEFVRAYAEHLKNSDKFQAPAYADQIKTGIFKELAPYDPDWYYIRAASIARKIYLKQGLGVGALSRAYGGAYRNGTHRAHHANAATGIIRTVLQQLEEMKVVEKHTNGGRKISRVGQQDLDRIATQVARGDL